MRIINPSLNPTLFVAFIVAVMIGTLVNISAKEYNARRHAYHHHQSAKQSGGSDAVSFLATTKKRRGMGASGLGDTPLWVCPNNGVCSNHSSVSNAAKNIGVCQDSRGNSIQPTRYCWVPTPGSPTPTVQNPSCECSWPSGTSGCVVSSPAPSFYACKCSLGNKVGTCTAIALPCYDATNYQCAIPDNSKGACELGKCNCNGYAGMKKGPKGKGNDRQLRQHSRKDKHHKHSRKKRRPASSRTSHNSALVTKIMNLGAKHEHIWSTLDPRKQTTKNRRILERLASANGTAPNGVTVAKAIRQLQRAKYNENMECCNRPGGTCGCCGSCCIFKWCECANANGASTASKATCGNDGTGTCCDSRQFVQSTSSHQPCSSEPQCGR